jgi:hypothetical protein
MDGNALSEPYHSGAEFRGRASLASVPVFRTVLARSLCGAYRRPPLRLAECIRSSCCSFPFLTTANGSRACPVAYPEGRPGHLRILITAALVTPCSNCHMASGLQVPARPLVERILGHGFYLLQSRKAPAMTVLQSQSNPTKS